MTTLVNNELGFVRIVCAEQLESSDSAKYIGILSQLV